ARGEDPARTDMPLLDLPVWALYVATEPGQVGPQAQPDLFDPRLRRIVLRLDAAAFEQILADLLDHQPLEKGTRFVPVGVAVRLQLDELDREPCRRRELERRARLGEVSVLGVPVLELVVGYLFVRVESVLGHELDQRPPALIAYKPALDDIPAQAVCARLVGGRERVAHPERIVAQATNGAGLLTAVGEEEYESETSRFQSSLALSPSLAKLIDDPATTGDPDDITDPEVVRRREPVPVFLPASGATREDHAVLAHANTLRREQ